MSNVFPSYLKPQFRAKLVSVFVFTTVLLFCSLLMTGLGPVSAHASQPPSSPHQQPKQKPRKNSGRDPILPHVQKPLKSMAGHVSQTPPDVVAQLSHSGTEPFAPGSDVTFTLKVSNAATGGPAPHHTTDCGGRNGYLTLIDLNTLTLLPSFKTELTPDPYSAAYR